LPPSLYFSHTRTTLTLLDAYPKAHFHLLVLPRLPAPPTPPPPELASLRALLRAPRGRAEEVLRELGEAAEAATKEVEREMRARFGCVWEVWTGFHAVPSMEHLHLHILSADLVAPALKTKRHYNSFRPPPHGGFFLPLADVCAWFALEPARFAELARLPAAAYEARLKDALVCFRCGATMANMPALKRHLQDEFD
ncbi:hypothetical protein BC834DRAFT_783250, partial [Gloeopeniophorella convolvens]